MIIIEDECVGCPPEIGCYGSSCPNKNVSHYFCDECGEEIMSDYDRVSEGGFDYHQDCLKLDED